MNFERYRRTRCARWRDERFASLTTLHRLVDGYIRTGPQSGAIPGLGVFSVALAAEDLRVSQRAIEKALEALLGAGLIDRWDARSRVLWMAESIEDGAPRSPANVLSWRSALAELPACEVKAAAIAFLFDYCDQRGPDFVDAMRIAGGAKPPPKPEAQPEAQPEAKAGGRDQGSGIRDQGSGIGDGGSSPAQPAPAPPPPDPVTVAELETGRDLYRPAYVDAPALLAAAARIDRAIKHEPKASKLDKRAIVACAVAMARDHRAKFSAATDEAILAKVETSLEKYVLGDIRLGKWRASPQASGGGGRRNDVTTAEIGPDFERDELAEKKKTERAQDELRAQTCEQRNRDDAIDRQRRSSRSAVDAFPAKVVFTPATLKHGVGTNEDDAPPRAASGG